MRQADSTPEDNALRTCLENMRFKACTQQDIAFLRTLIPSTNPTLTLTDPKWRDVSVITSWNTHKDQINDMHARRFAHENKVPLSYFYSVDKQGRQTTVVRNTKSKKQVPVAAVPPPPKIKLTREVQDALWGSQPHTSEHIAGCLPLCLGMPVMIRNNDATELNITKGQEAIVRGWTSRGVPSAPEKQALEVLFVELQGPAAERTPTKIPNLPQNIVPLTKISTSIKAILPDDSWVNITRHQVPVLLNFSMTDYASQGKTRAVNVVDVRRSRNHQAVYTALSRGTSAHATLILRDFNEAKITGGLSGYLREEFRALEHLDEITLQRYHNEIPNDVVKQLRASTIVSYRAWNKSIALLSKPSQSHSTSSDKPSLVPVSSTVTHPSQSRKRERPDEDNAPSAKRVRMKDVVVGRSAGATIRDESIDNVSACMKRSRSQDKSDSHENLSIPAKRRRMKDSAPSVPGSVEPWRTSWKWDSTDWSCAFDSILTVLRFAWYRYIRNSPEAFVYSGYLQLVFDSFREVDSDDITLELCRYRLRDRCWSLDRECFPKGRRGTDLYSLMHVLCGYRTSAGVDGTTSRTCAICSQTENGLMFEAIGRYVALRSRSTAGGCQSVAAELQALQSQCTICTFCGGSLRPDHEYPAMINIQMPDETAGRDAPEYIIDTLVPLTECTYQLTGVVYWGRNDEHFSVRLCADAETFYEYDGMTNGGIVRLDRTLDKNVGARALSFMGHRKATVATYVRIGRS